MEDYRYGHEKKRFLLFAKGSLPGKKEGLQIERPSTKKKGTILHVVKKKSVTPFREEESRPWVDHRLPIEKKPNPHFSFMGGGGMEMVTGEVFVVMKGPPRGCLTEEGPRLIKGGPFPRWESSYLFHRGEGKMGPEGHLTAIWRRNRVLLPLFICPFEKGFFNREDCIRLLYK